MCSYANPQTYAGCENTAGKVAERKANKKNSEHPVFDPQTRRRLHPFDFCALSFERHGFLGQRNNKLYEKASLCPCFRPRLGSVRGNLPLVWNNLVLHPTRQREGFAGRTSPGAAFTAAGTLVLHGPRSSAIAVVKFFALGSVVVVCR